MVNVNKGIAIILFAMLLRTMDLEPALAFIVGAVGLVVALVADVKPKADEKAPEENQEENQEENKEEVK